MSAELVETLTQNQEPIRYGLLAVETVIAMLAAYYFNQLINGGGPKGPPGGK